MQRPGRDQTGDELSARGAGSVRGLRRAALQSANPGSSLQRQVNRRRDGDDHRGGGRIFLGPSKNRAPTFVTGRYRPRLFKAWATESNLERGRGATIEVGHAIETRRRTGDE